MVFNKIFLLVQEVWTVPPERAVCQVLGLHTSRSHVSRVGLAVHVEPLTWFCVVSDLLYSISHEHVESLGIIVDVPQHDSAVSPEVLLGIF